LSNEASKARFWSYELGLLSRHAALATRGKDCPIYQQNLTYSENLLAKKAIQHLLDEIFSQYAGGHISEVMHVELIARTADRLSREIGSHLHENRFRIGVSQKLVNLYLKYLWVARLCPEPLHCPIDGRIRDIAGIGYDWTISDSVDEYRTAISQLKDLAGESGLAVWELENFRRQPN
jgi:hypothetical protein